LSNELFIRAEDLTSEKLLAYLVDTPTERRIIDQLKDGSPVVLKGSRGVGKSFLLRAAEGELRTSLRETRILPVYLVFRKAGLISLPAPDRFLAWMTAKICNQVAQAAFSNGLTMPRNSILDSIRGANSAGTPRLEAVEAMFEDSWKTSPKESPTYSVPDIDLVRDAIEELCRRARLERVNLLIDEAADVFNPEQQRQFFTLMRDLRSPHIAVKAAIYPGVTAFGDSFRLSHDATMVTLDRSVTDNEYLEQMKEMVVKQDHTLSRPIASNTEEFNTLAYAASGNPRALVVTIRGNRKLSRNLVKEVIQAHYRQTIWSEHSDLANRYTGHRQLIDWGRGFVEGEVLPSLHSRNHKFTEQSIYFLVARDAPTAVKHALQLLCYSGVVLEGPSGIRSKKVVGTRYIVNIGCQLALDDDPIGYCKQIVSSLATRMSIEYPSNSEHYRPLDSFDVGRISSPDNAALLARLMEPSSRLDVTDFQLRKFAELGLATIKDVLDAGEDVLMRARQVAAKRARTMRNAAIAAVMEYLSG
jgi:hypothetical protein